MKAKIIAFQHKVTGEFWAVTLTRELLQMPKPNKQQIRDAIDEEMGKNPHLGTEFAIHSVMDQYDISGLDVALAYINEKEEPEVEEVRTGDDASDTAAVVEDAKSAIPAAKHSSIDTRSVLERTQTGHPAAKDFPFDPSVSSKVADNTSAGEASKQAVPGEVKDMPNQGFASETQKKEANTTTANKANPKK